MSKNLYYKIVLKAIHSGQANTGKDGLLASLIKQLTAWFETVKKLCVTVYH